MAKQKTFILSDESLNSHGYWIRTEGIDLKSFKKNPVMLWNHNRSWSNTTDTQLPIGHWENLRIEDGQLLGDPVFDLNDPFAAKIAKKVEQGDLRSCSVGLEATELSEAPAHLKPGQTRRTVTKCRLLEVSICDIPANSNAVALYRDGKYIELSANGHDCPIALINNQNHNEKMKLIALKLGMSESASETEILAKLSEKDTALADVQKERDELAAKVEKMEQDAATAVAAEGERLAAEGVKAGKFDESGKAAFLSMYKAIPKEGRKLYDSLSVRSRLSGAVGNSSDNSLAKQSWDELDKSGKLFDLKKNDPETYKLKFREKFGRDPELV